VWWTYENRAVAHRLQPGGYWACLLLGFLGQIQARYSIVILWIKYLINAVYMALLAGIILYFGLDFDSSKLSIFFWQL